MYDRIFDDLEMLGAGAVHYDDCLSALTFSDSDYISTYHHYSTQYFGFDILRDQPDQAAEYMESHKSADEMDAAYRNTPRIDRNTAVSLTDDPRVVAFNYMTTNVAYGRDLEHVPLGNEENRGGEDDYVEPNLMIYANLFPDDHGRQMVYAE